MIQMNLFTKQKQTHRLIENKLMVTREEGWGEGIVREFGIDMYTLVYLRWITNEDLLYSTGNSRWEFLDGREVWGRVDGYMYMYG